MNARELVEQIVPMTVANVQREYPNGIQYNFVAEGEMLAGRPGKIFT